MEVYDIPSLKKILSLPISHLQNNNIDLSRPNNLGITPALLACRHNDAELLKQLHRRAKVNLAEPCDGYGRGPTTTTTNNFGGTVLFYALYFRKKRIIDALWELGYDLKDPKMCDVAFEKSVFYYAELLGRNDDNERDDEGGGGGGEDDDMLEYLRSVVNRGDVRDVKARVIERVVRGFLVRRRLRQFLKENHKACVIEKVVRGFLARRRRKRSNDV